jgi:hypothetical protein
MSTKRERQSLKRTSVQLKQQSVDTLSEWHGLNLSEALRATVERYQYLEQLTSPRAAGFVEASWPILRNALQDASYDQFRFVATSLPAILAEATTSPSGREAVERERNRAGYPPIDWEQLQRDVAALSPLERICAFDQVLDERYR